MKKIFLVIFLIPAMFCATAQETGILIKEANQLESSLKELAAYDKFKQVLKLDPRNFYALWKCSELCSRIGNRQPSKEKKADFFNAGRIYAESAIKVNPMAADGYYALSLAMGRRALMESGSERVKAVKEIRTNAEKALSINPNHGRAWHVIGKWNYEVSNLNAVEKAALKLFYGGLPPASLKDAIRAYEKASQLEPDFALNYLELAKAYHRNGDLDKAISALEKLPEIPNRTEDDARIKAEGKKLLQNWN